MRPRRTWARAAAKAEGSRAPRGARARGADGRCLGGGLALIVRICRAVAPTVIALCAAGCLPLGPIPGGELRGTVAPPPRAWASLGTFRTIQLETNPSDPYSVNVWAAPVGPYLYIGCRPTSQWLPFVRASSDVRLRIGSTLYELSAVISADPAERKAYLDVMRARYDWQPGEADAATALILRLGPRTP